MDNDPTHENQATLLEVTDWQDALDGKWIVKGDNGNLEVEGGVIKLRVDTGEDATEFELSLPATTPPGGDFALSFRMRFLSIGLMDNDTHQDSSLMVEYGQGERGPGMQITIVGDRYMVDVDRAALQYTIFRSAEGVWHDWRFEVRVGSNQLALFRNGSYCYLHQLQGERPEGLRIKLRGSAGTPTIVEFKKLNISSIPDTTLPIVEAPPLQDNILPGEWPSYRRDRHNSAHSPLVGNFGKRSPEMIWSYPLGGWNGDVYPVDLSGDGHNEILIAYEGHLAAYTPSGTQLWKRVIDNPRMFAVADLDEDGQLELVICANTPSQITVLDGATGRTRYTCDYDPDYGVRGLRIGKLDPGKRGLQMVVWSQHEIGYCLGFENGAENGDVLWTFNYEEFNFVPEIVLADMDKDGLLDVVLATYSHFFVYDGRSGSVKMELKAPLGRNYGLLTVEDISQDGYPDITMLAEQLREHVCVVKNEGGNSLRLLWDKFYEQDYPIDEKQIRTLPGSVKDWDQDGRVEILYGLFDETTGNIWRTLLVDAISGEIKISIDNHYPITLDTMPNGNPGVLLVEMDGRGDPTSLRVGAVGHTEPAVSGRLKAYTFVDGTAQLFASFPSDKILLQHSWREFSQTEWALYMDIRKPARRQGEDGYYFVHTNGDKPCGLSHTELDEQGNLEELWACTLASDLPPGHILDVINDSGRLILYLGTDSKLYLVNDQGQIQSIIPGGGVVGLPLAANLGNTPYLNILVNNAHNQLLSLLMDEKSAQPRIEWQAPSLWNSSDANYASHGQYAPMVFDWDQDGYKEVLTGQPPKRLTLLDSKGNVKTHWDLPNRPFFWNYGNFTGDRTFDVFVSLSDGFYGMGCRVYSQKNGGEPVWHSESGAFASAIMDANGDGCDDIFVRDLFWRRTLDGVSGRDIFPITQWAGYHIPTMIQNPQDHADIGVVWTGGNYSLVAETLEGEQVWWKPLMSTWHPAAIADVDGDGQLEIGAVTWGQVFKWPVPMDPLPGLGRAFVCLDLLSGEIKWSYDPGAAMSGVITADVDGDGLPEFIFGTGDGRLIALRGGDSPQERVVFSVQLPAALGTPMICDPVGNGQMYILVGCSDGNLYALK